MPDTSTLIDYVKGTFESKIEPMNPAKLAEFNKAKAVVFNHLDAMNNKPGISVAEKETRMWKFLEDTSKDQESLKEVKQSIISIMLTSIEKQNLREQNRSYTPLDIVRLKFLYEVLSANLQHLKPKVNIKLLTEQETHGRLHAGMQIRFTGDAVYLDTLTEVLENLNLSVQGGVGPNGTLDYATLIAPKVSPPNPKGSVYDSSLHKEIVGNISDAITEITKTAVPVPNKSATSSTSASSATASTADARKNVQTVQTRVAGVITTNIKGIKAPENTAVAEALKALDDAYTNNLSEYDNGNLKVALENFRKLVLQAFEGNSNVTKEGIKEFIVKSRIRKGEIYMGDAIEELFIKALVPRLSANGYLYTFKNLKITIEKYYGRQMEVTDIFPRPDPDTMSADGVQTITLKIKLDKPLRDDLERIGFQFTKTANGNDKLSFKVWDAARLETELCSELPLKYFRARKNK